ncbi:hypothetical protein DL89DRAFT_270593, partial [Linderina pennispora]
MSPLDTCSHATLAHVPRCSSVSLYSNCTYPGVVGRIGVTCTARYRRPYIASARARCRSSSAAAHCLTAVLINPSRGATASRLCCRNRCCSVSTRPRNRLSSCISLCVSVSPAFARCVCFKYHTCSATVSCENGPLYSRGSSAASSLAVLPLSPTAGCCCCCCCSGATAGAVPSIACIATSRSFGTSPGFSLLASTAAASPTCANGDAWRIRLTIASVPVFANPGDFIAPSRAPTTSSPSLATARVFAAPCTSSDPVLFPPAASFGTSLPAPAAPCDRRDDGFWWWWTADTAGATAVGPAS